MKKIMLLMFCMILLVGMVSAESFIKEFDNIKNYDEESQTVDIRNSVLGIPFLQLGKVAEVQLLTNKNVVINNINMPIARFGIYNYGEYNDFLKKVETFEEVDGGTTLDLTYKYKYFNENVGTHEEMKTIIKSYPNGTEYSEVSPINVPGSWLPFDEKTKLPEGYIEIEMYFNENIPSFQKIEVIPTFFGVRVDEWFDVELKQNYDDIVGVRSYLELHIVSEIRFAAQCFTPQSDQTVSKIGVNVTSVGDEGTMWGFLVNSEDGTSEGGPNGTVISTFTNVSQGTISTYGFYNLSFSDNNASLTSNETACIVLYGDGASSGNAYRWTEDRSGTYTYGNNWIFEGVSWKAQTDRDQHFRTWANVATAPEITVTYPTNNSNISSSTLNVTSDIIGFGTLINASIFVNGVLNQTNTSTLDTNYSFDLALSDGTYNVVWEAYNAIGRTREHNRFSIDLLDPVVTIIYPENVSYSRGVVTSATFDIELESTQVDTTLDTCWIEFSNNTNQTITCNTNKTITALTFDTHTFRIWANDSLGNTVGDSVTGTWVFDAFERVFFWNSSSLETEDETFVVNVTTNGSVPDNVELIYNGTTSSSGTVTNIAGNNYNLSRTIDVLTGAGNKTFYFNFTLDGKELSTTTRDQTISVLNYTFCASDDARLNFTFKNETVAGEWVDATFNSNWYYWAGSGTIHKQLAYADATENSNYTFCLPGAGSRDLRVNVSTTYANDISQQRQFTGVFDLGNGTTNQTLFLMPTASGIFMTIQVINVAEQVLSDVQVNATRAGELIESGVTDDAGLISFFLNPNFVYTLTFVAEGFDTFSTSITPQTQLTVTLGGAEVAPTDDFTRGITSTVSPGDVVLDPNTFQFFNFTLSSSFWTVSQYGFNLTLPNGTIVNTTRENANGGSVFVWHNTSNETQIFMTYYWIITGNETNATRSWIIFNVTGTGFSIGNFFTDLSTYVGDGMFGITSNGLTFIIYIILFLIVGVMSYKFGISSPIAITSMLFLIVLFFEVQLGLIPAPPNVPTIGGNTIPFATLFTLAILISLLIKERAR